MHRRWLPVTHDRAVDAEGVPFSWCEPPPLPRLRLGAYETPLGPGEQLGDRPTCVPAVDGTYPRLGFADCQPLGDPCATGTWPTVPAAIAGNRIYVSLGASGNGTAAAPTAVSPICTT